MTRRLIVFHNGSILPRSAEYAVAAGAANTVHGLKSLRSRLMKRVAVQNDHLSSTRKQ